ncbi:MAG: hypothetical protein IK064_01030, partial [Clostridia bacterium]|nr:hypothetical protein [Clostridia bacterium]
DQGDDHNDHDAESAEEITEIIAAICGHDCYFLSDNGPKDLILQINNKAKALFCQELNGKRHAEGMFSEQ